MKKLNLKKISETAKKITSWFNKRKKTDESNKYESCYDYYRARDFNSFLEELEQMPHTEIKPEYNFPTDEMREYDKEMNDLQNWFNGIE